MGTRPRPKRERPARHRGIPRLPQVFAASPHGFTPTVLPGAAGPVRRQDCCSTRRGAARVRRWPGPRPHSSGPVHSCQLPPPTRSGRPPGPARPAPDHRQGRGLPPAPGSPSPPEVRAGTATAPLRLRPLTPAAASVPECRTARSGAPRQQLGVGPSGAEQLSVRHVQLRGHAPWCRDYCQHL
ncbi:hypothetical protein NDU88_004787 [Pleurodeles waltl]|uniref:Uncharacterized protein n=1 Tax=Pleurodeles waltl TaxID=8319 RepID=A0AAV7RLZ4_PLEWA|nr:hypothetical protein NDU88_004787 [Pleurodeles waltl]